MFPEDGPVHQFLWTFQSRVSLPVRQLYCCYPFSPLQHKLPGCRWDLWKPDSGAETDCQYSSAGWWDSCFLSHVLLSSVPIAVKLQPLRGCCSPVPKWMGVWQQHVHQYSRHTGETTLAFLFIVDLYSLYFSLVVTSPSLSLSLCVFQWDLVCDKKALSRLTTTIFFIGVMFGAAAFGSLSTMLVHLIWFDEV